MSKTFPSTGFQKVSMAFTTGSFTFFYAKEKETQQQYLHKFDSATVLEDLRQLLAVTSPRQVAYIKLRTFLDRRRRRGSAFNWRRA
jgi:hypothetical protein